MAYCRVIRWLGAVTAAAAMVAAASAHAASPDNVFTIGNYPVEGHAGDAQTAKTRAVADGQKAAFRSLLKRLVPVTSYARLKKLANAKASDMLDGVAVKSERNSATDYLANLDFSFQPQAVRTLLQREGLGFVDAQAPSLIVVPVWRAGTDAAGLPAQLSGNNGAKSWSDAWKGLDLDHALTPVKIDTLRPEIKPDAVAAFSKGEVAALRPALLEYKADTLVFAIAEPDVAKKRLNITLAGRDEVGDLGWRKSYRIDLNDPGYAVELAAVVSLGVLEGRWKAMQVRGGGRAAGRALPDPVSSPGSVNGSVNAGSDGGLQFGVEFRGMGEWQSLSRRLAETPGVEDVDVAGLSARGARVSLKYAGSIDQLADAVSQQGMALRRSGAGWVLTAQ
jgi:Uncharacterized protein conserved in bacteria (DUF2066)